ncbi:MAG: photosynthetic protein synthase I, partial [Methylococcales bacterium]|nr:photosynthetic protein synthase I [Methylococcales bacterium]
AFLHPETVINDVKTVLSAVAKESERFGSLLKREALWRQTRLQTFADNEKIPFQQEFNALIDGMEQPFDLLSTVKQPPLGLPAIPVPANNPLTKDKVQLGRKLFYDRRLSLNNTFSCAMCHIPEQGFTNNQLKTAVGFEGRTVRRNAPSLFNVAFNATLFHDGRETSLENQVWGPLLAANEMANPSIGYVIEKIKASADYAGLFQRAFKRGVSMETVAMAIASYERTLNAADSRFDRWFFNDQKDVLAPLAQQGYRLFVGKARCASCHTLTNQAALFTDEQWHNTGLGYQEALKSKPSQQRVQLAPGQFVTVDSALIATVSEQKVSDLGRYEVTQDPKDKWRYRTPSLRNISLTAPYMHNGQFSTLQQVVNFYDQGGIENPDLDPLIVPLHLTGQEKKALVYFLEALTGSTVASLVLDGISAPVADAQ